MRVFFNLQLALLGTAAASQSLLLVDRAAPDAALSAALFDAWSHPACENYQQCWNGADCATSLYIGGGRHLWLFGDSIVGSLMGDARSEADARRIAQGSWLPAHTLGVAERTDPDDEGPTTAGWRMAFHWRHATTAEHAAEPLFALPNAVGVDRWSVDVSNDLRAPSRQHYLWPLAGVSAADLPFGDDVGGTGLVLLAAHMNERAQGWIEGTELVVVPDARGEPASWQYTTHALPFTDAHFNLFCASAVAARQPAELAADEQAEAGRDLLGGGASSNAWGEAYEELVYVLGCTDCTSTTMTGSAVVLARARLPALLDADFGALQYWTTSGWQLAADGQHPLDLELSPLFFRSMTEGSLVWHPQLRLWYILVLSEDRNVELWTAAKVTGPWTLASAHLYSVPSPYNDPSRYMVYAVKAHPELAAEEGEIVISYNTNALELNDLFTAEHRSTYVPQLVRISLRDVRDALDAAEAEVAALRTSKADLEAQVATLNDQLVEAAEAADLQIGTIETLNTLTDTLKQQVREAGATPDNVRPAAAHHESVVTAAARPANCSDVGVDVARTATQVRTEAIVFTAGGAVMLLALQCCLFAGGYKLGLLPGGLPVGRAMTGDKARLRDDEI